MVSLNSHHSHKNPNNSRKHPSQNSHPSSPYHYYKPDCNYAKYYADDTQDRNCKFPRNTADQSGPINSMVTTWRWLWWCRFVWRRFDSDFVGVVAVDFPWDDWLGVKAMRTGLHLKQNNRSVMGGGGGIWNKTMVVWNFSFHYRFSIVATPFLWP